MFYLRVELKKSTISIPVKTFNMSKVYAIAMMALGAGLASFMHYCWTTRQPAHEIVDSTIVLNKIEAVSKLVTAEGHYVNVYRFEDYQWMNAWPFRKEALVKVKLKALVGLDLKKMKIVPDEVTRTFYIDSLPPVEPIAIDPVIEFLDMDNSVFNAYGIEELNRIQRTVRRLTDEAVRNGGGKPKNLLEEKFFEQYAAEIEDFFVPLLEKAREEGNKQLVLIETLAQAAGWKVVYRPANRAKPLESKT